MESLSAGVGAFLFFSGMRVLYQMRRTTPHARRIAWVIISTGALGVTVCSIAGVGPDGYYLLTLGGVAVLMMCGVRGASDDAGSA